MADKFQIESFGLLGAKNPLPDGRSMDVGGGERGGAFKQIVLF